MITLDIFGQEPNKKQINEGVAENQDVDVSVVVGKLYDIIDQQEDAIKNADYDRQVKYATIVRNRAIEALNMIKLNPRAANSAWKYFQTGQQGVAEEAAGKFQLPGVGSWLNVGQQQQATDDTPGNFSIVVAGRQGKDFQAITLAKALETILPKDYPRSGWPNTPGSDRTPTHYVIQEVLNRGQAVVKDGIGSKDVADSIAVKFKKYGIPAYVEGALEEARAATASFRRSNKKRAELNAMSDEERKAHDKEQQEKQRKRDDARLEREREKLAAKKKGVAEGTQTVGHEILGMLRQIRRQGDDAMEELYSSCPLLAQFWDQYEGDFRSMVIELSPKTLTRIKAEILAFNQQGVAEAGNKPLEKSYIGTGDTRTPRELKNQMQGASDEFVRSVADKKTGPFHSKVAKMQGKLAKSELRRREQGVEENSMADFFAKAAQEKFPTATIRKNGQTIQEPPKRDVPKQKVDVAKLKQQYAELKKKYDQLGGDSWQYADRMMDRDIEAQKVHQQLNNLARWISNAAKDNVKEQGRDTDLFGRSEPSFDDEYVKPTTTSKKSKASSWADPASSDYVGRREVARRQAAQPAQPAKVAEPQWSPATGAYSTQAAKQQRPTTPMTATPSGNGKKLTPQEYIRRIGIDEGRMNEIYAEYQDYKKLSPREFYDMYKLTKQQWLEKHKGLLQGMTEGDVVSLDQHRPTPMTAEFVNWLKANHPNITMRDLKDPAKRNALYRQFQQQGLAEANKKKDELGPEIRDVTLQRAVSRAKADFPTAGSGLEALAKDFMRSQDQDQKSFDQLRQQERRQDQMLKQIDKIDLRQNDEIKGLEQENSSLSQRLQQLQSVNSNLEKKLAAMSSRKPKDTKKKAEPKAEPKAADININVPKTDPIAKTEPRAEPKVSYTINPTTTKKAEPKSAKNKKQDVMKATSKELSKNQGPMAAMTQRITKGDQSITDKVSGQSALPFEPTDNVLEPVIPQRQQDPRWAAARANASDVDPRYYADLTSKIARNALKDPEAAQRAYSVHENDEEEADYGDEYQDMVARVGQKAKQQEKDKPVDIADLARRLAAIETSRKD